MLSDHPGKAKVAIVDMRRQLAEFLRLIVADAHLDVMITLNFR